MLYTFYREYAVQANGTILEPMCGTGRFYYHCLKRDSMYYGLDAKPAYVECIICQGALKKIYSRMFGVAL